MLFVLDASALINEPNFSFEKGHLYMTTQAVVDELKSIETRHLVENAIHHRSLETKNPSAGTVQGIRHVIAEKGFRPLSKADVSVIALAKELKEEGLAFRVLTDDYSIQNFLGILKIPFSSVIQGEIRSTIEFQKYCPGCSKTFSNSSKLGECDFCGTPLRSRKAHPEK